MKLYTHLCPFGKSKSAPIWSIKSDRVNLVAPAGPVLLTQCPCGTVQTGIGIKGWPGSEIKMYYGCPCYLQVKVYDHNMLVFAFPCVQLLLGICVNFSQNLSIFTRKVCAFIAAIFCAKLFFAELRMEVQKCGICGGTYNAEFARNDFSILLETLKCPIPQFSGSNCNHFVR